MSLFLDSSYRKILHDRLYDLKSLDSKTNFQAMARSMGIQKSYLSKVIAGNADLNSDQLFLAGEFLQCNENEMKFLMLLLEHEKCSVKKRKEDLASQIERIRAKNRRSKEHLSAVSISPNRLELFSYYFDPLHQIVHMALAISRYAQYPSGLALLAQDIGVNQKRIQESFRLLEEIKLITVRGQQIEIHNPNLHLDARSPIYRSWQNSVRVASLKRLDSLDFQTGYTFSVSFSADQKTRDVLQSKFLEFLKEAEALTKSASSQDVYQMNFELFPWTKKR